jgi:3-hydroxybutyryl-CoA dehydratase
VGGSLPGHTWYWEDFEVGQEMRTPGRTITEADVVSFAGLSGDYNPLHTDKEYASAGPFGQRIAHGLLGLSVASGLVTRLGILEESVLAFREMTCKFRKPIFIGDTVYVRVQVMDTKAVPRIGGGSVKISVKLHNQDDEVVQTGVWTGLMRSRASILSGE